MTLTKKQVLEAIEAMPEERFTHIDVVIEELILLKKLSGDWKQSKTEKLFLKKD